MRSRDNGSRSHAGQRAATARKKAKRKRRFSALAEEAKRLGISVAHLRHKKALEVTALRAHAAELNAALLENWQQHRFGYSF